MKLTEKQILRIDTRIPISADRMLVEIDVSHKNEGWSLNEIGSNIYCIDEHYNIIWQVKEIKTEIPFEGCDPFCYLAETEDGDIMAVRFSGFRYKINQDTGEAMQTGFRK